MISKDTQHSSEAGTRTESSKSRRIAIDMGIIAAVVAALEIHFALKRKMMAKRKLKDRS